MPRLIGLTGRSGAGKDTVAAHLVKRHGFVRYAIADDLKRAAAFAFGLDDEQLWGCRRDELDPRHDRTPRELYQQLGDSIRHIAPSALVVRLRETLSQRAASAVVVTDVRMPVEVDTLRAAGATIWRVTRSGLRPLSSSQHCTELALDGLQPDAVLSNDGSIDDLAAIVDRLVAAVR